MSELATNLAADRAIRPDRAVRLVRVRYFAGARAAAGVAEEDVWLPAGGAEEATVGAVLAVVRRTERPALERVLAGCSFLLDGVAVHDRSQPLPAGAEPVELDVLPPFAGG